MSSPITVKQEINAIDRNLYVPLPSTIKVNNLNIDSDSDSSDEEEQDLDKEMCDCICDCENGPGFFEEVSNFYTRFTSAPYYQQVYSRLPSILSAAVVSFNLGELTSENVAIVSASYAVGDILFPVIVANYSLVYLYDNYLYDKF